MDLRDARIARLMRQIDLAARLNVSEATLSLMESGRRPIRPEELTTLERVLGVQIQPPRRRKVTR